MKLFERRGQKMIPTEFADDLYKELINMRDTANSLRLKFQDMNKGEGGHLNIGVGIALQSSKGFVKMISDLNKNFPNITLNITSMIKDTSVSLLENGTIDLWIGDISNLEENNQIIKKFIKKIPLVIYVNKRSKLLKNKKILISQLQNQRWSLNVGGVFGKQKKSDNHESIITLFKNNNIKISNNFTTFSSPSALFASVQNNGNLAIAAKSLSIIANNFDLKELKTDKIVDMEVGILVRNKIANYKIIKFLLDLSSKYIE
jgi:DNA-binding transcriptional LysR family regulator